MSRGVGFGVSCQAQNLLSAPRDVGIALPRLRGGLQDAVDTKMLSDNAAARVEATTGFRLEMDDWPLEKGGSVKFDDSPGKIPAGGRARLEWLMDNEKPALDLTGGFPGMRREPVIDRGGPPPVDMPVAYEPTVARDLEFGSTETMTAAVYQRRRVDEGEVPEPPLPDLINAELDADVNRADTRMTAREEQRTQAWLDRESWRDLPVEERQLRTPLTEQEKATVRERYDRELAYLEAEMQSRIDFTSPTLTRELMSRFAAQQHIDRLPDALIADVKLERITPRPRVTPAESATRTQGTPRPSGYRARRDRELANRERALKGETRGAAEADTFIKDTADRYTEADQQARELSYLDEEAAGTPTGSAPPQYTDTTPYEGTRTPPLFNPDAEGAGLPDLSYMDTRPRSRYELQLIDDAKNYRMRDPLRAKQINTTAVVNEAKAGGTRIRTGKETDPLSNRSLNDIAYSLQPGDVDSTIGFPAPTRDPLNIDTIDRKGLTAGIRPDELRAEASARFEDINGRPPRRVTETDEDGFPTSDWHEDDKRQMETLMREIVNDLADTTPSGQQGRGITAEDWTDNEYIEGQEFLGFDPDGIDSVYYNPDAE